MTAPLRVALYGRVGTNGQTGFVLEQQKRLLSGYAAERGYTVVEEVYECVNALSERRPSLDRLLADAKARRIDKIVSFSLSRFFRRTEHLMRYIRLLEESGVVLETIKEGDTFHPLCELYGRLKKYSILLR